MDDKDKGPDIFDRFFSGFFESGFDRHFNEMSRQMEEMFKNMGDINITVGTLPPGVHGSRGNKQPMGKDPRDLMLKDPEMTNTTLTSKPEPLVESSNYPNSRRPFFPSLFENRDFKSPFPDRVPTVPSSPDCGCEGGKLGELSSPWQTSSTSSSTSFNMGFGSGSWSGQSVRTIRHPDGSVEEIVKKTENGRTCTTVTKTDPHGVTTSTTTCDRPAIDGGPNLSDPSKPLPPPPGVIGSQGAPGQGTGSDKGKLTKDEEVSFFKKYLGFDLFKPKS